MKTLPKRLFWPDFCRAIAMYLVIVIHTSPPLPAPSLISFLTYLFFSLTKISVPLFVMVSGALLIPKQDTYRKFFTKRIIHVLIPWVFWTVLSVVWLVFSGQEHPVSVRDWVSLFHITFFTRYWFIPMLFTLYLLTPLFHLFVVNAKTRDLLYSIGIWFIGICLIPSITALTGVHIFSEANIFLQYSGYYLLGYVLSIGDYKKNFSTALGLFILSILALSAVQLIALLIHMPANTWILGFLSPLSASAAASFFVLSMIFDKVYGLDIPPIVKNSVVVIGGATLGIYFIHIFLMQMLLPTFGGEIYHLSYFIAALVVSLVIFFLSFFVVFILRKLPLLHFLVP